MKVLYLRCLYFTTLLGRCFVEGVDLLINGTILQADWNSSAILQHVPLRKDKSPERCYLFDGNSTAYKACDMWVYDETHHPSSRAIDVGISQLTCHAMLEPHNGNVQKNSKLMHNQ